ncbi:MAG: mandelate racemase/muconate lactonizing enzyme family protein [Alcaligenaceae bacterium]|jgi:L-alanine-DL-glutamate epimerase-like enolase superfamily enzyme
MTIRAIDTFALSLPFEIYGPRPKFAGLDRSMEILLVRVETDSGIVGWGEAFGFGIWPATRAAIHAMVAPLALGRDETNIAVLMEDLNRKLHIVGRTGPMVYALSGLDIALWDIAGKAAGKPVSALLGGAKHTRLPCYASLMRYTDPLLVAENSARVVERGYGAVKLHELGVEQVKAARNAIGPSVGLMMDVNCPWNLSEALKVADAVRPYELTWFEEPIWPPEDFETLAKVRTHSGLKIAAGENAMSVKNFEQMFKAGAVDIAQPSVTKIGGISAMMAIGALAQEYQVVMTPHCPYFGPGLLASVHIAATHKQAPMIEYSFADLGANPLGDAIEVKNGYINVPTGPGLGRDPNPEIIKRYSV